MHLKNFSTKLHLRTRNESKFLRQDPTTVLCEIIPPNATVRNCKIELNTKLDISRGKAKQQATLQDWK